VGETSRGKKTLRKEVKTICAYDRVNDERMSSPFAIPRLTQDPEKRGVTRGGPLTWSTYTRLKRKGATKKGISGKRTRVFSFPFRNLRSKGNEGKACEVRIQCRMTSVLT